MKPHTIFRSALSLVRVGILFLFGLSTAVQAQFTWQTNTDQTITITRYIGTNAVVNIPSAINGMAVVGLGDSAFQGASHLTSVTIPGGIVTVGDSAFASCYALTNVTIGNGLVSIGNSAFFGAELLTSIVVPDSVTSIGAQTFLNCGLTHVTLGRGITQIGVEAFGRFFEPGDQCSIFFKGNAPIADTPLFKYYDPLGGASGERQVTVYYISGASGWSDSFAGRPDRLNSGALRTVGSISAMASARL